MKQFDENKDFFEEFKKSISSVCENIGRAFFEELDKIAILIQLFYPFLFFVVPVDMKTMLCFTIFFTFVSSVLKKYYLSITSQTIEGIPVPFKKYTVKDIHGFIELKNDSDFMDVLVYMDRLETYLEKRGLLKDAAE